MDNNTNTVHLQLNKVQALLVHDALDMLNTALCRPGTFYNDTGEIHYKISSKRNMIISTIEFLEHVGRSIVTVDVEITEELARIIVHGLYVFCEAAFGLISKEDHDNLKVIQKSIYDQLEVTFNRTKFLGDEDVSTCTASSDALVRAVTR